MLEQEIKLSVPYAARKAIAAQFVSLSSSQRLRLRAMYFDTADRQLARQRAAIRIRQEGRKWVQTFKMAGENALSRIELNHPCPGKQLDLSHYVGTPAESVLAGLTSELVLAYETDVRRTASHVRTRGGTVEIAYDIGTIKALELELPLCELEFELVSGKTEALFTLARRWLKQHRLVLDVRSKAERGDALARAAGRIQAASPETAQAIREAEISRFWAARSAKSVRLKPRATPEQALAAITAECFDHIVRNAAALAAVDVQGGLTPAGTEHVHQLRVGMRRLRSAWRLFDAWAPLPDSILQQAVKQHFADFGRARDSGVLGADLVPALLKAGMPAMAEMPPLDALDASELAKSPEFQVCLLSLLAWSVGVRPETPSPAVLPAEASHASESETVPVLSNKTARSDKLLAALTPRLQKWHRRLAKQGKQFAGLDADARHSLRKLGKRLRYALSFTESLYASGYVRPYRKRLSKLQDVLGEINDLLVAREHYAALTTSYPQAWFALGWIAARLDELDVCAAAEFAELSAIKPFWK